MGASLYSRGTNIFHQVRKNPIVLILLRKCPQFSKDYIFKAILVVIPINGQKLEDDDEDDVVNLVFKGRGCIKRHYVAVASLPSFLLEFLASCVFILPEGM
jgi:hypothetical protein